MSRFAVEVGVNSALYEHKISVGGSDDVIDMEKVQW